MMAQRLAPPPRSTVRATSSLSMGGARVHRGRVGTASAPFGAAGGGPAHRSRHRAAQGKEGRSPVGMAPQYAPALGRDANGLMLVSPTLAGGEVPVPVVLRLSLPECWTGDAAGLDRRRRVCPEGARPAEQARGGAGRDR